MAAGHNLDVTASSVSAGHNALLSAGNDLSLNAVRESKNSRNGRSESHESHAAVSTVTAGDNLLLVAGRDVASQAAGVAAENNVVIRGGRDVNLVAESAAQATAIRRRKRKRLTRQSVSRERKSPAVVTPPSTQDGISPLLRHPLPQPAISA